MRERLEKLNSVISEMRTEQLGFKDHVFKSILATHNHEEEMSKLKERIHQLSAIIEKKQISLYEGNINVST